MLRRRPTTELSRGLLAVEAGVTSTLVSYYFPDQLSLIVSVAKPLVDTYLDRLKAICADVTDPTVTLRKVVLLFLEVRRDNGELIDNYNDYVRRHSELPISDFMKGSHAVLDECLNRIGGRSESGKGNNNDFLQTALWGMCTAVAQSEALGTLIAGRESTPAEIVERQADLIVELLFTKDRA